MRVSLPLILSIATLCAACQAQVLHLPARTSPRPQDRPVPSTAPVVTHEASVPPTAGGSASPLPTSTSTASPVAPPLLQPPADGGMTLKGHLTLDAAYIVASGAGNLLSDGGGSFISHNGGAIVASGAGNFIGHNGSAIVAQGGGNAIVPAGSALITTDGGAIVAQGGGNIVAQGGGNVVSPNSGNIVAQGGGNIVAQGGGNIVAQGGGNAVAGTAAARHLLDAAPSEQFLPVGGAELHAFSLLDGSEVPLGQADGKPAFGIYTNAAGEFTVYLPKSLATNVRLVAALPLPDGRLLRYDIVSPATAGGTADVDESHVLACRLLLEGITSRFREAMGLDPAAVADGIGASYPKAIQDAALPALTAYKQAITDNNLTSAEIDRVAQKVAERLCAIGDLTGPPQYTDSARTPELQKENGSLTAFEVLVQISNRILDATIARAATQPGASLAERYAYFDRLPVVDAYRRVVPGAGDFHVHYAADMPLFGMRCFLVAPITRVVAGQDKTPFVTEALRYNGLARLLEAEAPADTSDEIAKPWDELFIPNPDPAAAPALSDKLPPPAGLGLDQAIPTGSTERLSTGVQGVLAQLYFRLFLDADLKQAILGLIRAHGTAWPS